MAAGAEQPVGRDLPDRGTNEQTWAFLQFWIPTPPQRWEGSCSWNVSSNQTPPDAIVINIFAESVSFSVGVDKVVNAILHSVHEPCLLLLLWEEAIVVAGALPRPSFLSIRVVGLLYTYPSRISVLQMSLIYAVSNILRRKRTAATLLGLCSTDLYVAT